MRYLHPAERIRSVIGVFVNELDLARNLGRFQLLGHFDNNTIPFADTEIKDGQEVTSSSVIWGTVSGWLGAGIRIPVAPFQSDNDLRLQLFYQGGYFYDKRTSDTGANVKLPPDTIFQGLRFRARYDGFRRNIMELPNAGWASGGDLEMTFRDKWSDSTFGDLIYKKNDTQQYLKLSGYLIGASGIPWLGGQPARLLRIRGAATEVELGGWRSLFRRPYHRFFYDSQLYLEYAYDNKFLRNGTSGSSFMLLWSKEF
jgi:hypothetical protein